MKYTGKLSGILLVSASVASGCAALGKSAAAAAAPETGPKIELAASGDELRKLQAALATVGEVMSREQIWTNFAVVAAQHAKIYVGPSFSADGTATAAEALALLRGRNAGYIMFPAQLTLTGTYYDKKADYTGRCRNPSGDEVDCRATAIRQNYSNMMAVTHGLGRFGADGREIASIELGREVFNRYNSSSALRRSCTFNTLAHEWTHTIGKAQNQHWSVVEDTDVTVARNLPQLSYLFGAVAQCTWLQGQGAIGRTEADLKACASRFGAVPFPDSLCV